MDFGRGFSKLSGGFRNVGEDFTGVRRAFSVVLTFFKASQRGFWGGVQGASLPSRDPQGVSAGFQRTFQTIKGILVGVSMSFRELYGISAYLSRGF